MCKDALVDIAMYARADADACILFVQACIGTYTVRNVLGVYLL